MKREELLTEFDGIVSNMRGIMERKNSDYCGAVEDDPFANFSRVEAIGICTTDQGMLVRMTDKLCRMASFVRRGSLKVLDESVEDTALDLANYAILFVIRRRNEKRTPKPWSTT